MINEVNSPFLSHNPEENISQLMAGQSTYTYIHLHIHILGTIFRLVRTSLALTDMQQSAFILQIRMKNERNEWVSERKNKHISKNVYMFIRGNIDCTSRCFFCTNWNVKKWNWMMGWFLFLVSLEKQTKTWKCRSCSIR